MPAVSVVLSTEPSYLSSNTVYGPAFACFIRLDPSGGISGEVGLQSKTGVAAVEGSTAAQPMLAYSAPNRPWRRRRWSGTGMPQHGAASRDQKEAPGTHSTLLGGDP